MQRKPTVLLADADVRIDYRESDLAILALVARHLGRLAVLPPVLDEVRGVTAKEYGRLGVEIVEVETERMLRAAEMESSVSFNDRLCPVVCRIVCSIDFCMPSIDPDAVGHVFDGDRVGQFAGVVELQAVGEQEEAGLRAGDGVVAVDDGVDDGFIDDVESAGGSGCPSSVCCARTDRRPAPEFRLARR